MQWDKVLILDGNQRSALAAARSLGKRNIQVIVGDEVPTTLAGSSRYCHDRAVYPSPYTRPEDFIAAVRKICCHRGIKIVFPMTDISNALLLKHRNAFDDITIPGPALGSFESVTDKWKLYRLATALGVKIPGTLFIKTVNELSSIKKDSLVFPIVIKPYRSRIFNGSRWINASVRYAQNWQELTDIIMQTAFFYRHPFLIQQFVPGTGQGVFALYDNGRPVVFFAHRRLREKPPTGGVSVLSESIETDSKIKTIAEKLLTHVAWHGVAMVEFKKGLDGIPYLIEINGRFWGSLQLAIDAGVDFPWLLFQLANGGKPDPITRYRIGVKSRWLLGDLDHLYLTLFKNQNSKSTILSRLKLLRCFFNFDYANIRYDINRWEDMRPFLFELRTYLSALKSARKN